MKEIYNIEEYSIMIECKGEKGTGVFISSRSTEYDYIITAKHCLKRYTKQDDISFQSNARFNVLEVFKHDTCDIAIIQVEKNNRVSLFNFINYDELINYSGDIYLYGYPKIARNKEIKSCKLICKFNDKLENIIRLEVVKEISTFKKSAIELLEGMSGCAAYIEKDNRIIFIGIYNENSFEDFAYRYINTIPLNIIKEILIKFNLMDLNLGFSDKLTAEDIDPLYINYEELVSEDHRNLKDKILEVSPQYNNRKIRMLSRRLADATVEIDNLTYKRKASLLYRVFISANEKQFELLENSKENLTEKELDLWIDKYTDWAKEIIEQKSEDYKYPLKSRDIIKGAVLQLINDCYISFDEKGFYD